MEPLKGITKKGKPYQLFSGVKFYLKSSGYYKCADGQAVWGERRLHRAVWVHYNGPIPCGYVIHHKDHEKGNNHSGNLELLSKKIHDAIPKFNQIDRVCTVCKNIFSGNKYALYCTTRCSKAAARLRAGSKVDSRYSGNVVKKFICTECGVCGEYRTFTNIATKLYCSTRCKIRAKGRRAKLRADV